MKRFAENNEFKKWMLILGILLLLLLLYSFFFKPNPINKVQLIELKVDIIEYKNAEGGRNPYCLYISTSQYQNLFGVKKYIEREHLLRQTIEQKSNATIKIKTSDRNNLNKQDEVVDLQYLKINNVGLIFDENEVDKHMQSEFKSNISGFIKFIAILLFMGFITHNRKTSANS